MTGVRIPFHPPKKVQVEMPSKMISHECSIHGFVKHRKRSDGGFRGNKCEIEKINKLRIERKTKLIAMLGGGCAVCGYSKYSGALHFHHREPNEKKFTLSLRDMTKGWGRLLEEVRKCQLVCANCHAELHASES